MVDMIALHLLLSFFSFPRTCFWREHVCMQPAEGCTSGRNSCFTMDDHDELAQTLLDNDQPSWVTLSKEDHDDSGSNGDVRSSAWDRNNYVGKMMNHRGKNNELPKFIPILRLGNMGAAMLLIYGSVSWVCDYNASCQRFYFCYHSLRLVIHLLLTNIRA
jgi:hypothetical protein